MKIKYFLTIGGSMLTILFLLNACGQSPLVSQTQGPPEATLTFSGDACTYNGPKSLPGKFDLNVVVEGGGETMYGYVITTLMEGKTIEDLQAWPSTDPPAWLKNLLKDTGPVFGSGNAKQNADLFSNAAYAGEPIYFVCFADSPTPRKIGALGPIEITK